MIWNILTGEERLAEWKRLRGEISDSTFDKQINGVVKFCSKMPIGSRSLDYYTPASWPTPWEILYYGTFCQSSISLLMIYTLKLSQINQKKELHLIEDDTGLYLLPIIDNKFVLNYELGSVNNYSDVKDAFKTLKIYSEDQTRQIN